MDAVKHRDRFDTKPTLNSRGQPIRAAMTGHQPHILSALAQHNTLSIYDIHTIVGGDLRSVRRAARILKDEPNLYIRIVPEQLRTRNLRQNLCYQLAPRGVEWLNANGQQAQQPRRVYNLGHTGLVSHIMASFTAGVSQYPNAKLVSWDELQRHPKFPPETAKTPDNTTIPHPTKGNIRPDWHPFAIALPSEGKMKVRFIVIEADNGTETIYPNKPGDYKGSSIYAKFEAYLDFIENKRFHARYGWPNYFVLFVFTSQQRLSNAMTLLGAMSKSSSSKFILFQLANQNGEPGYIFTTPCERVGFDPLQLNQP